MSLKYFSIFRMAAIFSVQQKDFSNLGRESLKEQVCEIILKSGHWPRRRFFSIFSSGGHIVQRSKMIFAILVEGHPMIISVKLF